MELTNNKHKTQLEYFRRINKALKFIDENLDQAIQLDDVAVASHFSSYHFHRIFHALVGETVNEYVLRKRMERAANRLVYKPILSITEVSVAGGFSSSANFSKAFKLYFGVSPSVLRKRNVNNNIDSKAGKLYSKYGKSFNPEDLYSQFVTQSGVFPPNKLEKLFMKISVETYKEKPIAFLTSPKGYDLNSVYATWDKITQWASNIGIDSNHLVRYGLCYDNPVITPEDKCRYEAAIEVNSDTDVVAPYEKSVIPAGQYAVAYYKDDAEKISHFMTELCSQWFPDSGYEPDDYPPVFNYLNDSRKEGYVEMNIYFKVKKLKIN